MNLMVKLKNFSKIFEDDKLLTLTLILWEGGQLPNPNECNSDTNPDECNSTLTSAKRGETLTPNPNECNSDTNPNECNSDNIFWKWEMGKSPHLLKSVPWTLAEFYFNRGLQRPYTSTCIILQKTINGFLWLLIGFLKSKTHQLNLKDVIKLNRNLW